MLFATEEERALASGVARLAYSNPFLPERVEAERTVLGADFDPAGTLWHTRDEPENAPNIVRIGERVGALAERLRERLAAGARAPADDLALYEELVMYLLFDRHQAALFPLVREREITTRRVDCYRALVEDLELFASARGAPLALAREPAHLFATFFQVRRAFHHIYATIVGASGPARHLRAAVWQSVFTHDARRYRPGAPRPHGRHRDPDHRALGHGQGAGGPGHRALALHPV